MRIFIKEMLISLLFSILFILVLALLISQTSVNEKIIIPGIITISSMSTFFRKYKNF